LPAVPLLPLPEAVEALNDGLLRQASALFVSSLGQGLVHVFGKVADL
jgi:hypothetical protein